MLRASINWFSFHIRATERTPPQTLLIFEAYDITEVNVIANKKITIRYNISILMLFWFIIP